jgi:NitT/TauT family transport system substrate-binding protein/sulfonate transport system substrate-binding protein
MDASPVGDGAPALPRRTLLASAAGLALAARRSHAQTTRSISFFVVNNIFGTPVYVAAENGYWAQRGLDVKLRITSSGREVGQALQAGEADLGHVALSTSLAAARASGNLLKGVMPYYSDALYVGRAGGRAIVGRRDRGIVAGDPTSFYGKTVAILAGSTNELYCKEWMRAQKLDLSRVKFVSVPVENMPVTLRQGLVDAAAPWEPYTAQIVRELGENAVVVSRGAPGLISDVVGACANQAWIEQNYDALFDFAAALAEAAQFVRKSPHESAEILARYLDGVDVRDAEEGVRYGHWDPRSSVCTVQGLVQTGNQMADAGLIKLGKPFVPGDLFDPTVLERVQAKAPEFFADLPPLPATLAACKGALPL